MLQEEQQPHSEPNPNNPHNMAYLVKLDEQHRAWRPAAGSSTKLQASPFLEKLNYLLKEQEFLKVSNEDSLILDKVDDHFYLCHLIRTGNKAFIEALMPTVLKMLRTENSNFFAPYFGTLCKTIATYAKDESLFAALREMLDVVFELQPDWLLQLTPQEKVIFYAAKEDNLCFTQYCLEKFVAMYPLLPERLKNNAFGQMYLLNSDSLYDVANKDSTQMMKLFIDYLIILFSIRTPEQEVNEKFALIYPEYPQKELLTDVQAFKAYINSPTDRSSDAMIIKDLGYIVPCLRALTLVYLATDTSKSRRYVQMVNLENEVNSPAVQEINIFNHGILMDIAYFLTQKQNELQQNISFRRKAHDFLSKCSLDAVKAEHRTRYKSLTTRIDVAIFALMCYLIDLADDKNTTDRRYLKKNHRDEMCYHDNGSCVSATWRCSKLPQDFEPYVLSYNQDFKTNYEHCNLTFILWCLFGSLVAVASLMVFMNVVLGPRSSISTFGSFSNAILQSIFIKPLKYLLDAPNEAFADKEKLINLLKEFNSLLRNYFIEPTAQRILQNNSVILEKNFNAISMNDLIEIIKNMHPWVKKMQGFETILPEKIMLSVLASSSLTECSQWQHSVANQNDEKHKLLLQQSKNYHSINYDYT